MKSEKLRKIEAFSDNYKALLSSETLAFNKAHSWEKVRQDWWLALIFFFDRAFYQGRSDYLGGCFELATVEALDSILGGSASRLKELSYWLQREHWKSEDNPFWQALGKKYDIGRGKNYGTGRERDREMTLDSLRFILNDCEDCNILEHSIGKIASGRISELSDQLHQLISVGPKIASFFLRDTVFVYDLESYLKPEDYPLLIPIDTWVRTVADWLQIPADPKVVTSVCQDNGVNPIKFNQGAWYLGSHSLTVLLDRL